MHAKPLWCVAAVFAASALLPAQCPLQWQPGHGMPGVALGEVLATIAWDVDGSGPAPARLVVAGSFGGDFNGAATQCIAGRVSAPGVACWDPATGTWSALGSGFTRPVRALAVLSNGDLVAGGDFPAGPGPGYIARWNGTSWQPLGAGLQGPVLALAVLPNGDLVAGGHMTMSGSLAVNHLARWNGTSWQAFGTGVAGLVASLLPTPSGELFVGGNFTSVNGTPANSVARWDGASWSALGTGVDSTVLALHRRPDGSLLVGGAFTTAGGLPAMGLARWDGSAWSTFGANLAAGVFAVTELPGGDVVVAVPAAAQGNILRGSGGNWTPLGGGTNDWVRTLCHLPQHGLVAGGGFTLAGATPAARVAWFDGSAWQAFGSGSSGAVRCILASDDGDVVVGGDFVSLEGVAVRGIARSSGTTWAPLGSGIAGSVHAVARLPNGDLVVAGAFADAGGVPVANIARWDGSAWWPMGSGMDGNVEALLVLQNGDLLAGGWFSTAGGAAATRVARWSGGAWSPVGAGLFGLVQALVQLPNGDVVAGGQSLLPVSGQNSTARWDGSNWTSLFGPGFAVSALALSPNGELIAAGSGSVARWDGAYWWGLGYPIPTLAGYAKSLLPLPDGDLLVGGDLAIGTVGLTEHLVRWNGAWQGFQAGPGATVRAMARRPDGEILLGGDFLFAGGAASCSLARLRTPCPALAQPFGIGCSITGAASSHQATTLPWLGSTFRGRATGLPAQGLAVVATGLQATAYSLSTLPLGLSGCFLYVQPDLLQVVPMVAGVASTALSIPEAFPLLGQVLHQQVIPIELTAAGAIVRMTSTNALILTIGML